MIMDTKAKLNKLMYYAIISIRYHVAENRNLEALKMCDFIHTLPIKIFNLVDNNEAESLLEELVIRAKNHGLDEWFARTWNEID